MKNSELLHTKSESSENNWTSSNEEVQQLNYEQIDGTAFTLIGEEGKEWLIAIGHTLATPKNFETKEEAIAYIETKPWEMITAVITQYTNYLKMSNDMGYTTEIEAAIKERIKKINEEEVKF